jgi:amino acid adenylation domain-containing protein
VNASLLQRRMWYLQQADPDAGPAYNVCTATDLDGAVDVERLREAVRRLVTRHGALRTTFTERDGVLLRVVADDLGVPLEIVDAAPDRADPVDEVAMTRFDVRSGPLLRVVLVRRGPQAYTLMFCLSHAIADGWTMGILHREISELYAGRDLAPAGDFDEFVAWAEQRRQRRGEQDLAYWRAELADAPANLNLPGDLERPAVQDFAGRRHRIAVPAPLRLAVQAVAAQARATPYAVYLTAFALALRAWSGQDDLVIGVPFANRRARSHETIVGPAMELMTIRLRLAPPWKAGELVEQVRTATVRAMSHVDVGFDELVRELRPERDPGRHPLVQAMFLMQNSPLDPVSLPGCVSRDRPIDTPTARLDLAMDLTDTTDCAVATVECPQRLFSAAEIERFGRRWLLVLEQICGDPGTAAEDLVTWLPDEVPVLTQAHADLPVLHGFLATADPCAVAVESSTGSFTYAELQIRSGNVAAALLARGVRPGDVVAVRADRSPEQIVALLGVLRAGAAYLPLDPDHPVARAERICHDAGVSVSIDAEWVRAAPPSTVALPAVRPDDTAYVMYTSGSTGAPKGVMVSHRSAAHMIDWGRREIPMRPGDRMLGKTPYTFDISVWEIFATLTAGATLVLADPGQHRDSGYVAAMLADAGITVTHFVPTMLRGVLAVPGLRPWPALRCIIAGGEAFPADLAARVAEHFAGPVYNFYGPTEATIYVSWHTAGDRTTSGGTVPIGRPVTGCGLYILDERLRPVPDGAHGELYLGGIQVAQGYLGQAGLTATRFLPDPFSDTAGARMYRTGDLVRRAGDGTVDFVGRRDGQVKLRGFRIELGEVEAALRGVPGVAAAAVELRDGTTPQLVAHVIAAGPDRPDAAALRCQVAERLPAYMVPARFSFLDRLPLTSSGKLDRTALATLPLSGSAPTATRPPQQGAEATLAHVWSGVLGVAVTDADADFFSLGGDSISAVVAVAEANRQGLPMAVRDLFRHPTVASLARAARRATAPPDPGHAEVGTVLPDGTLVLPLGPMQQYAVQRVAEARLPGLYVVCFTAAVDGQGFDVDAWERTWRELARRHAGLRTTFQRTPGGWNQLVLPEMALPFTVSDLTEQDDPAAEVTAAEDAERAYVIDPTDAPLWRMRVFRIGSDQYRIICRLSYLVQDGWSVSVLQDEWLVLYEAYRSGQQPNLPPPAPGYHVHLGHLARRDLGSGREYWRKQLAGVRAAGAVTAALRARCRAGDGPEHQTVRYWMDQSEQQRLHQLTRDAGLPLFPALQAAWALLLGGLTGRDEVLFGTISAGRSTVDIRRTYGSFNSMMPTAVRFPDRLTVRQLLVDLHRRGPDDRDNDHVPLAAVAADAGVPEPVDLLDTYLVHENFPVDLDSQRRFLAWRPDIAEMRTEHALRMLVWPVDELSLHLSFDARLLSAVDAEVLLRRYVNILAAFSQRPDDPVVRLLTDPWSTP